MKPPPENCPVPPRADPTTAESVGGTAALHIGPTTLNNPGRFSLRERIGLIVAIHSLATGVAWFFIANTSHRPEKVGFGIWGALTACWVVWCVLVPGAAWRMPVAFVLSYFAIYAPFLVDDFRQSHAIGDIWAYFYPVHFFAFLGAAIPLIAARLIFGWRLVRTERDRYYRNQASLRAMFRWITLAAVAMATCRFFEFNPFKWDTLAIGWVYARLLAPLAALVGLALASRAWLPYLLATALLEYLSWMTFASSGMAFTGLIIQAVGGGLTFAAFLLMRWAGYRLEVGHFWWRRAPARPSVPGG